MAGGWVVAGGQEVVAMVLGREGERGRVREIEQRLRPKRTAYSRNSLRDISPRRCCCVAVVVVG